VLKIESPPKWVAGDVIDIRFSSTSTVPYTYVRGVREWPGDSRGPLSDDRINDYWRRGLVDIVRKK